MDDEVADEELLARFITQRSQFRSSDETVKPDLFIPYRHVELSVTRHDQPGPIDLWQVGRDVVSERESAALCGRSDVTAIHCRIGPLTVSPDPILPPASPTNPNHANILGFPEKKEDQKALAIQIAAKASKRIPPPG
ncbi:hypothetical protein [Blastopirellula marina]|uniref:Uncharacterized protein n=1 Tax=Blastopirellula marina DSM 3645 TaxID=314230 RepID=A3ZNU2_9BACT|nr:hypothetical protein [Blastopirellula marina]EAQ81990.1 hypothetical protein DSM3645_17600 [Blastopirellula marina DSM 3645]